MRKFSILTIVCLLVSAVPCFAQGVGTTGGCNLAGSWYGGAPEAGSPYYHVTIAPISGGRISFVANMAFEVSSQGILAATPWIGELSRTGPQSYEGYTMQMLQWSPSAGLPPDFDTALPELDFVHSRIDVIDCNTFKSTIDILFMYPNFTNQVQPLIDAPAPPGGVVNFPAPGIVEIYRRMPTSCPGCPFVTGASSAATMNLERFFHKPPKKK